MDLAEAFGIRPENLLEDPEPSYNVAPTDLVPAVLARTSPTGGAVRELRAMHWGLVPWWATDIRQAARRINARVETVAERPAYRAAVASRRCLLPANGYYEWASGTQRRKQPYFLHPPDGRLLPLAGLYERWQAPGGGLRWTCTMLTTVATGPLGALHHRTPMVVPAARWLAWLDPTALDPGAALALPVAATDVIGAYPVHARVGNVRDAGPHLMERDSSVAASADFAPGAVQAAASPADRTP